LFSAHCFQSKALTTEPNYFYIRIWILYSKYDKELLELSGLLTILAASLKVYESRLGASLHE